MPGIAQLLLTTHANTPRAPSLAARRSLALPGLLVGVRPLLVRQLAGGRSADLDAGVQAQRTATYVADTNRSTLPWGRRQSDPAPLRPASSTSGAAGTTLRVSALSPGSDSLFASAHPDCPDSARGKLQQKASQRPTHPQPTDKHLTSQPLAGVPGTHPFRQASTPQRWVRPPSNAST